MFGVCAPQCLRAAIAAACGAECATGVPEPDTTALQMRQERLELMKHIGVQDVAPAPLLGEIEPKFIETSCAYSGCLPAGATERLDGKGAG